MTISFSWTVKEWQRRLLILFIIIFGLLALYLTAQTNRGQPPLGGDIPIPAIARLCVGSQRYTEAELEKGLQEILKQGCDNMQWRHIENGEYLVFGTGVITGE